MTGSHDATNVNVPTMDSRLWSHSKLLWIRSLLDLVISTNKLKKHNNNKQHIFLRSHKNTNIYIYYDPLDCQIGQPNRLHLIEAFLCKTFRSNLSSNFNSPGSSGDSFTTKMFKNILKKNSKLTRRKIKTEDERQQKQTISKWARDLRRWKNIPRIYLQGDIK